ncbi:MAG: DNA-deoxyinosine glycosylase [Candidatus Omnitrophica bacterium]|nr:DNA-deoxyinosine glycosylase [Candidatus Omnitrophota bacterium]
MKRSNLVPVVTRSTRILILGSMPSQQSLQKQQYYGNSQNHFWKIVGGVFEEDFPEDYARRLQRLRGLRVGLWDVIASCHRNGSSLDSAIKDARINDFGKFLLQYRHLNVIGCNGGLAYRLFTRHVVTDVPVVKLPSSSPAHAVPLQTKIAAWRRLLRY